MPQNFSCLIPFYNEGESLPQILTVCARIPEISQIIAIDDGSGIYPFLLPKAVKTSPKIQLIKLKENRGKAEAVSEGLKMAKTPYILLLDADYIDISQVEIARIIKSYVDIRKKIDMLLVKVSGGNNFLDKLMRKETLSSFAKYPDRKIGDESEEYFVSEDFAPTKREEKIPRSLDRGASFTGFRILKTSDLKDIFQQKLKGYQLEVAINEYMISKGKNVFYTDTTIKNVHKSQKWGLIEGYKKSISMEVSIIFYLGFKKYIRQVLCFGKKKLILFKGRKT